MYENYGGTNSIGGFGFDGVSQQYSNNTTKKGGLYELASALGKSAQELKLMSRASVEQLAQEKGVNLNDYERPGEQQMQARGRSQFGGLYGM